MIQSVIKNEIYMSARYIRQKDLLQDGVCIVGSHRVADYLKAAAEYLGKSAPLFPSASNVTGAFTRMWYVLEEDKFSEDDLQNAIALCKKQNAKLIAIILLSNIKPNDIIQKYAEMELLTVMDEWLGRLRDILSGYENISALFFDRIFGADFDCLKLAEITRKLRMITRSA